MHKLKTSLEKEKETLMVPLLTKALESLKNNPIISDPYAVELVGLIEYENPLSSIPDL